MKYSNSEYDFDIDYDNIEVECVKRTEPFNMPSHHYHDFYEIYYLLSGERYYFVKNEVYHIIKGDLIIIHPNEIHKTLSAGSPEHERFIIYFRKPFLDTIFKLDNSITSFDCFGSDLCLLRINQEQQIYIENTINEIISECSAKPFGYKGQVKLYLMELIISINRNFKNKSLNISQTTNILHKKVGDILKYLNENYSEEISLTKISLEFSISKFYLSKIFKKSTGFSLIEYLNSIRIKEAQKLLRETELSVTQISEAVGYANITHFIRMFKALSGISPLKYRRKIRTDLH